MFGIKNFLNWASIIFTALAVYLAFNHYNYRMMNEAFFSEGIAIILFIFMTYILENIPSSSKNISKFIFAILFSTIFLTINTYLIIPLTIAFLFYFRNNLYFIFGGLIFISLSAYFINVAALESDKINITFETLRAIPIFIWIIYILTNFYLGWIVADRKEVLFSSGFMIFLLLVIISFYGSPIQNRFLLTAPLFLFSLKSYKVDRFLGKVYKTN